MSALIGASEDILGRQPVTLYIAPSKPNPWYGTIVDGVAGKFAITGGERFTAEQAFAIRQRGLDLAKLEVIAVTRNATTREMYWSKSSPTPQYQFECPVLARRRDGRISVISPSGLPEIVDADGFAGRAKGGAR
jgi:hypothetical protein